MVLEVPVHAASVPPNGIVLGVEAAAALVEGGVALGDVVETPSGPRTVLSVREGGLEAWSADGTGEPWRLTLGPRSAERLRVHRTACNVPEGGGYDPVHHTPLRGAPITTAALDWLRSRGAAAVLEDVAWRQDHLALARIALAARERGERPGPAWRELAARPELGLGPVRMGLWAAAWVLGFDLDVRDEGIRLGLRRQEPPEQWSSGVLTTAGAFRKGHAVPGGMQDPDLVGDRNHLRYAHIRLPWRLLPGHLTPWVADLLDTPVDVIRGQVLEQGAEVLYDDLEACLAAQNPRLTTLDGRPLHASDFLWSTVPVVPGAYRRSVRNQGQRVPHGIDGTLHALIGAVRSHEKAGSLHPQLEFEVRVRVQQALDGYLVTGAHVAEGWGWSVAQDIQSVLRVDGVMIDWGGQAVATVEPGRERVALPRAFESILLRPREPEAVLLFRLPDGVTVARPTLTDGTLIRLPLDVAGALGARTGDLVRVVPAVSGEAQDELEALAEGLRLSPMVRVAGWLEDVASAEPEDVGAVLTQIAREQRVDACRGAVGARLFAGITPTPRDEDLHEIERVQRGFALLMQALSGPGNTMPPGVATKRLDDAEAILGAALAPELRSLWSVHDGQSPKNSPQLVVDGIWWRLSPLQAETIRDGRITLAVADSGEVLDVDASGRVWRGDVLVTYSVGRLLQLSFATQRVAARHEGDV